MKTWEFNILGFTKVMIIWLFKPLLTRLSVFGTSFLMFLLRTTLLIVRNPPERARSSSFIRVYIHKHSTVIFLFTFLSAQEIVWKSCQSSCLVEKVSGFSSILVSTFLRCSSNNEVIESSSFGWENRVNSSLIKCTPWCCSILEVLLESLVRF